MLETISVCCGAPSHIETVYTPTDPEVSSVLLEPLVRFYSVCSECDRDDEFDNRYDEIPNMICPFCLGPVSPTTLAAGPLRCMTCMVTWQLNGGVKMTQKVLEAEGLDIPPQRGRISTKQLATEGHTT
jgi:hypothetical protein